MILVLCLRCAPFVCMLLRNVLLLLQAKNMQTISNKTILLYRYIANTCCYNNNTNTYFLLLTFCYFLLIFSRAYKRHYFRDKLRKSFTYRWLHNGESRILATHCEQFLCDATKEQCLCVGHKSYRFF